MIYVVSVITVGGGQNGHIPLLEKICMNLPLFAKYLAIYHFFETRFCGNRDFHGTRVHET